MKLKQYIEQQGLLQIAFARQLGVSRATVSMLISGARLPSPALALRIEEVTKKRVRVRDWDWPDARTGSSRGTVTANQKVAAE